MTKIGVLALQGAFKEHCIALRELGVEAIEIRLPEQLQDIDGLVIPGGESTTIGKLMVAYGLLEPITKRVRSGLAVFGTCAGMIVLAKEVKGREQPLIGAMNITVDRNAFGSQVDSFETDLLIQGQGKLPLHAVFIRAPIITEVGAGVEVLATLSDGAIVAARQDNMLVAAFHPELTNDRRLHKLFLELVKNTAHKSEQQAVTK